MPLSRLTASTIVVSELVAAGKVRGADASDELQVVGSEVRSTFENGNDAAFTKAFVGTIFIEIEPAFLLVVEEVEVLFGKFLLGYLFVFASR